MYGFLFFSLGVWVYISFFSEDVYCAKIIYGFMHFQIRLSRGSDNECLIYMQLCKWQYLCNFRGGGGKTSLYWGTFMRGGAVLKVYGNSMRWDTISKIRLYLRHFRARGWCFQSLGFCLFKVTSLPRKKVLFYRYREGVLQLFCKMC